MYLSACHQKDLFVLSLLFLLSLTLFDTELWPSSPWEHDLNGIIDHWKFASEAVRAHVMIDWLRMAYIPVFLTVFILLGFFSKVHFFLSCSIVLSYTNADTLCTIKLTHKYFIGRVFSQILQGIEWNAIMFTKEE